MKKNGFVLVETIVVVVFLTVSLLMIYKSFTVAIQNEKIRAKHNNAQYLYRTYFIKTYLEENKIGDYFQMGDFDVKGIIEVKCDGDTKLSNQEYCSFLTENFSVDKMYVTKDGANIDYSAVEPTTIDYLKTISRSDGNYRLVIKFEDEEYASLIILV